MPNEIPISGAGSAGILLPDEQGEMLTNGVLQENGFLRVAGDARTTNKRRTTFPIWLGKPTAGPVGEGERKPVTGAEFGQTDMTVKKFASIVLFTDEQIEDVQDGDMNVLVDSGVREALATSIDAHGLGHENGAPITSVFTNAFRATAHAPVAVDLDAPNGLQRGISAAIGELEDNGYGNIGNIGAVLGHGFGRLLRDATEVDANGNSVRSLYGGDADPLYGIDRAVSTNLARTSAAPGSVIGYVVHKPNVHVRLRTDVRVKVSNEATIELPNGDIVNLYQDNMTAVRYELRLGVFTHDISRAVVPLTVAA